MIFDNDSWGRELVLEAECDEPLLERMIESRAEQRLWQNKKGELISFDDMSDKYISNCIEFIHRVDKTDMLFDYIIAFENELKRRKRENYV